MAKLLIILTLVSFLTIIPYSKSLSQINNNNSKTIFPPFRVYLVEIVSGPSATLYEVARATISTTPTSFGVAYVTDAVMTAGPGLNSQKLGRIQGTITYTGLIETANAVNYSFLFAAGKYKGSSLIVSGQRLTFVPNQEIPIAGGTGIFRGARGYVLSSFVPNDSATDTTVFEYNFYVVGLN